MKLGEIGRFYGGLMGKSKKDFIDGNAKYATYKNVFSNIELNLNQLETVKIDDDENQHKIHKGDILFTGSSETIEESGMTSVVTEEPGEPVYLNSFCFGFRLNDNSILDPGFTKFLFRGAECRRQIVKAASGVTRFNLSKKRLESLLIPLPPLEEQRRIAGVLDKFEALTSSLSEGLPAEIAARRRQYAYWRERLLGFGGAGGDGTGH